MSILDRVWAVACAAGAAAGLAWASNVPMDAHPSADAVLRVAWSARPERVEKCRALSQEELGKLPRHMRQEVVCEGISAAYRLEVRHEGRLVARQDVRGGGLRGDRRLYVFRDVPLPAGEALIDVQFRRVEPPAHDDDVDGDESEEDEPGVFRLRNGRGESVPPRLAFTRRLRFPPREVVLVTYDPARRALVPVGPRAR